MTDNRVQIIIRTTDTERDQVKKKAQEKDVSMNQFILDAIFDSKDDSTSDSSDSKSDIKMIEILEGQLAKKDEQIEQMQKLLDQQQQLTLQSNQQIERLQLNEPANPEKNKGLFSRWFGS